MPTSSRLSMGDAQDPDRGVGLSALVGRPYRDAVAEMWGALPIWDNLRYDDDGDLWFGELRLLDALGAYGSPLEVVDTLLVERRCREWRDLAHAVAAEVGYPGRLDFLYASKANMASEFVHAAYRAGWHAETSSAQDLNHLRWMSERALLPEGFRVVCNGFKLPPSRKRAALPDSVERASQIELKPDEVIGPAVRELAYAAKIVGLVMAGWDITPILDTGELEFFAADGMPKMNVGLRAKFGPVSNSAARAALNSRFGFDDDGLHHAAELVARTEHLTLTTLHTMVGAAQAIPIPTMVEALGHAGEIFAKLRSDHPSLVELNMGGGVPPLGEAYDHRALLRGIYTELASAARSEGVPPPNLTFEFGSLVAAEAGLHIFHVLHEKVNDVSGVPWAILDGGLMAAIPDILLIDKPFRILAVRGANRPARAVRLGDLSCDSDGRYPPESFGADAVVLLPESDAGGVSDISTTDNRPAEETWVAITGVGAYQEILSGVRGAHHCGLLEAVELIIEPGPGGIPRARLQPRQTREQAAELLGYTEEAATALREAMAER